MSEFGPQNGVVSDFGTDLPNTQVEKQQLNEERNAAKFSKSKEFQVLKDHFESRIAFYQTQLPDGRPITDAKITDWIVANLVVAEFKAVLAAYENAREAVERADAVPSS